MDLIIPSDYDRSNLIIYLLPPSATGLSFPPPVGSNLNAPSDMSTSVIPLSIASKSAIAIVRSRQRIFGFLNFKDKVRVDVDGFIKLDYDSYSMNHIASVDP